MRVLWFTNIPMPAMDKALGNNYQGSGFWMKLLLEKLSTEKDMKIGVVSAWPNKVDISFTDNNIDYFVVGQPRKTSYLTERTIDLNKCLQIIKHWQPDLIHIHGTERFYGVIKSRKLVSVPTLISIQGMLGPYLPHIFGNNSIFEIFRSHRFVDIVRGRGLFFDYLLEIEGADREREIFCSDATFLGRTTWDYAHLKEANHNIKYSHVGEMIRDDFVLKNWDAGKCMRNTVIFTNAGHPRRGAESLLKSISILKNEFPNIKLLLAGNIYKRSGYGRRFLKRIEDLGLSSNIELLGYLDSSSIATALIESHVFCIASHIENSPNSLCEAQMTGMPCVASYAGGIPSLVDEGKTGLLFPPGDAAVLADCIRRIFNDDEFATELGKNAKNSAMKRHNPELIINQLITAYNQTISNNC